MYIIYKNNILERNEKVTARKKFITWEKDNLSNLKKKKSGVGWG